MIDELGKHVRAHLESVSAARDPRTPATGSPPLRPMYIDPAAGPYAPGEAPDPVGNDPDAILSAYHESGIPAPRHEGFIRTDSIDIHYRVRMSPEARRLHRLIRGALGDRRSWDMDGLHIEESLCVRELEFVTVSPGQGFHYVAGFTFELWSGDNPNP